jgi:ASC-1-like (ASCH) protein
MLKLAKAKEILLGLGDTMETLLEQEQIDKFTNIVKTDEQTALQEFKKLYSDWDNTWWTPLGLQ